MSGGKWKTRMSESSVYQKRGQIFTIKNSLEIQSNVAILRGERVSDQEEERAVKKQASSL